MICFMSLRVVQAGRNPDQTKHLAGAVIGLGTELQGKIPTLWVYYEWASVILLGMDGTITSTAHRHLGYTIYLDVAI